MGPADQPDFVNAAATILTKLDARELFQALKNIEDGQGKRRDTPRWGPRVIDLDLLVMGSLVVNEPDLRIPHPGIAERNFVLLPLADIAPHLQVPGRGSVQKLLAALGDRDPRIERLD
jgi:2-amino-4-hydroxy-6-hydroxymethyldihydropteridine diphosphokinase